jgi:hypothetical protein
VLLGQVVSRNYQPALIDSSMELPLTDLSVGVGLSSFDVESLAL